MTLSITIICHQSECRYAERRSLFQFVYAECQYAECRYAECRGALISMKHFFYTFVTAYFVRK